MPTVVADAPRKTIPFSTADAPGPAAPGPTPPARRWRVLWVNESADFVGGCEKYAHDTAALLRAAGCHNTLLYDVARPHAPRYCQAFDQAFPMVDIPAQVAALRPDVIYVHRLSGVDVTRAVLDCGLPTLRFVHDHKLLCLREHKYTTLGHSTCARRAGWGCYACLGFVQRANTSWGWKVATLGALRAEQSLLKRFTACVVGSHYMRDHLVLHGVPESQTRVAPLYAPAAKHPPAFESRDPHLLLFAGQLVRGKGLDVLLRALPRLAPPTRLEVIGAGPQEAEWRALAARLGVGERVAWVGKQTHAQVLAALERCAALVFPSRSPETFGQIGVEAMSRGAPVVASDVGGVREWLAPGRTGELFPSNDHGALASTLHNVLGDAERRRLLGEQAHARHAERFLPEHHVNRLLEIFAEHAAPRTSLS